LLRKLEYSPKANARRTEARGASPAQRNEQFGHINEQRSDFITTGDPIISVDTKKSMVTLLFATPISDKVVWLA
jgi:hypothetical protein